MELVKFNKEKHLPEINDILKSYNWEPWDDKAFDNDRHYCVVENNQIVFFSGFYLFDNGIFARLGIVIGNRGCSKEKRSQAFQLVISHIFKEAEALGVKALEYATSSEISTKSLIEMGMKDNSPNGAKMLIKEFQNSNLEYLKEE